MVYKYCIPYFGNVKLTENIIIIIIIIIIKGFIPTLAVANARLP